MNDNSLINMKELLEIMDDDKELIKECFNEFINDASNMLERIKNAIESGDAAGLDSSAHKIKGSLTGILQLNKLQDWHTVSKQWAKTATLTKPVKHFRALRVNVKNLKK